MNPISGITPPGISIGYSTYKSKRTSSATIIPTDHSLSDTEPSTSGPSKYLDLAQLVKLGTNGVNGVAGAAFRFGSSSSTRSIATPPTDPPSSNGSRLPESPFSSPSTRATSPAVEIIRPDSVSPIPLSSPPPNIGIARVSGSTAIHHSNDDPSTSSDGWSGSMGKPQTSETAPIEGEESDVTLNGLVAEPSPSEDGVSQSGSSDAGPSNAKPALSTRASTFRHVPLRSSKPVVSSPLRPSSSTRTFSGVSRSSLQIPSSASGLRLQSPALTPSQSYSLQPPPASRTTSHISPTPSTNTSVYVTPLASPGLSSSASDSGTPTVAKKGPSTPSQANGVSSASRSTAVLASPGTPASALFPTPPQAPLVTEKTLPSTPSAPASRAITPSRPSTANGTASPSSAPDPSSSKPALAPYRPGFQPKGVYSSRTDELLAIRSQRMDGRRAEEKRLTRRLEKLVDLHFSPESTIREKPPPTRRSSSIFDLADLKGKGAADLWKGVVESTGNRSEKYIRDMEQSITHWEDDKNVSLCPICSQSFHPLTNRKHHCRLCGRVVCSLPPRQPIRPRTCSLLIIANPRTGKIEEVPDTIAYGVTRKDSTSAAANGARPTSAKDKDAHSRGVRICRDCNAVVQRQQFSLESAYVPPYARLYRTLIRLEQQIEETLPQFQELIVAAESLDSKSQHAAASARKELLEMFAEYDTIAKRIRALPCAAGGSQDRLQAAITMRANLFLQQHMLPLKSLAAFSQKQKHRQTSSQSSSATASSNNDPTTPNGSGAMVGRYINTTPLVDSDSAMAHSLQPLLEQEALLESYVEEAMQARKFDDAKTIKTNLNEIRAEIEKIARGGGGGRGR